MSEQKEPLKITQKIVGYAVKTDSTEENKSTDEVDVPNLEYVHEGLKRPFQLKGTTYRLKPPQEESSLYLTINNIVLNGDEEYPFEMFVNAREMSSYQWIVALTRSASAVFRKGGNITFLVQEYEAVKEPNGGYFGTDHFAPKPKGKFYDSVVAEIGYILRHHFEELGLMKPQIPPEAYEEPKEFKQLSDKEIDESIGSDDEEENIPPGYFKMDIKCIEPGCNATHFRMKDGCPECPQGHSKCG